MQNIALASLAYEVGDKVGDPSTAFTTRVKTWLNERYDDAYMRGAFATTWSLASSAPLGDADIPLLGLGLVIKTGAIADAWDAKRQFTKAAKYETKYEFALGNFIISKPWTQVLASFSRYEYHEE